MADCDVYWGSHGCDLERGHAGDHRCGVGDPEGECSRPYGWSLYGHDVTKEDRARYCIGNSTDPGKELCFCYLHEEDSHRTWARTYGKGV